MLKKFSIELKISILFSFSGVKLLIKENIEIVDKIEILKGLTIVTNYMEKNIFSPNNMKIPAQRKEFENLLNNQ